MIQFKALKTSSKQHLVRAAVPVCRGSPMTGPMFYTSLQRPCRGLLLKLLYMILFNLWCDDPLYFNLWYDNPLYNSQFSAMYMILFNLWSLCQFVWCDNPLYSTYDIIINSQFSSEISTMSCMISYPIKLTWYTLWYHRILRATMMSYWMATKVCPIISC